MSKLSKNILENARPLPEAKLEAENIKHNPVYVIRHDSGKLGIVAVAVRKEGRRNFLFSKGLFQWLRKGKDKIESCFLVGVDKTEDIKGYDFPLSKAKIVSCIAFSDLDRKGALSDDNMHKGSYLMLTPNMEVVPPVIKEDDLNDIF